MVFWVFFGRCVCFFVFGFFFQVLHIPSFSTLVSLQREHKNGKHFADKQIKICFLWAKADNSVVWHTYKHSIFKHLKEISDSSYLRSRVCNRTVTNFPQLQRGKYAQLWNITDQILCMISRSYVLSSFVFNAICIHIYVCVQSKWSLNCLTSVTDFNKALLINRINKTLKKGLLKLLE